MCASAPIHTLLRLGSSAKVGVRLASYECMSDGL